jgi:group I intron endonuclease
MSLGRVYIVASPSGRIYVGSTIRLCKDRWRDYRELNCKKQIKLYESLKLYGVENHVFYEAWVGDIKEMYKMEAKIGKIWEVLDRELGLNCFLPKDSDVYYNISEETRKKQSISAKNKPPRSEETKIKMRKYFDKGASQETRDKISRANIGKIVSLETREKIRKGHLGKKLSKEHILKISNSKKGKRVMPEDYKITEATKQRMSEAKKGKLQSQSHIDKKIESKKIPIIQMDMEGNFIKEWDSAISIKRTLNIHAGHISSCCKGKLKSTNKFKFKYKTQ